MRFYGKIEIDNWFLFRHKRGLLIECEIFLRLPVLTIDLNDTQQKQRKDQDDAAQCRQLFVLQRDRLNTELVNGHRIDGGGDERWLLPSIVHSNLSAFYMVDILCGSELGKLQFEIRA